MRMRAPFTPNEHERVYCSLFGFVGVKRVTMEDARFFHQRANRCYQLAWQSFDLQVAHKLNRLGNEHKAKARELGSHGREAKKLLHPRNTAKSVLIGNAQTRIPPGSH